MPTAEVCVQQAGRPGHDPAAYLGVRPVPLLHLLPDRRRPLPGAGRVQRAAARHLRARHSAGQRRFTGEFDVISNPCTERGRVT